MVISKKMKIIGFSMLGVTITTIAIAVPLSLKKDEDNDEKSLSVREKFVDLTKKEIVINENSDLNLSTLANQIKVINEIKKRASFLTKKQKDSIKIKTKIGFINHKDVLEIKIIIILDQKEETFTFKFRRSNQVQANEYVTNLNLDNWIYKDSSAKMVKVENQHFYESRFIYIESKNLFIRFALTNHRLDFLEDNWKKFENDDLEIKGNAIRRAGAGIKNRWLINEDSRGESKHILKNSLDDKEKAAMKKHLNKNDVQINNLLKNMKFAFAFAHCIKFKNNLDYPYYGDSNNKNDYIYSNLLDQVNTKTSNQIILNKEKDFLKDVDLSGYTQKVKKISFDVSKTNYFSKVNLNYKDYKNKYG